ncbi:hypothetical protein KIPE111705_23125 [Kibdelosporangium persicum]
MPVYPARFLSPVGTPVAQRFTTSPQHVEPWLFTHTVEENDMKPARTALLSAGDLDRRRPDAGQFVGEEVHADLPAQ